MTRAWRTVACVVLYLATGVSGGCREAPEEPMDRTDLDFDGVLDFRDKCIGRPETWNNFKDGDGCPDEAPEPPPQKLDIGGKIQFAGGGDVILRQSYSLLDGVISLLKDSPNVKLRIEGHTDNVGSESANQTLSRKRAEAVVKYLEKGSIDPSRLAAVGMGSNKPVAPNDTEEGRALNRRVEFHVTSH